VVASFCSVHIEMCNSDKCISRVSSNVLYQVLFRLRNVRLYLP